MQTKGGTAAKAICAVVLVQFGVPREQGGVMPQLRTMSREKISSSFSDRQELGLGFLTSITFPKGERV